MGRSPCCSKEGLNRGAWTSSEDQILVDYIKFHGEGKWRDLPKKAGLKRCGKSCRLRWLNYLRPDIKRGNISCDEEDLIIRLHKLLGNRWSLIAGRLPGRTDNEIKNYWNTCLRKKVRDQSNHTPNGKNTNETQRNKKPTKQDSGQFHSTPLFHTKALRCNKIFVSPQENTQDSENSHLRTIVEKQALQHPAKNQEEGSPDFSTNFEIEELFVSDILNTDFFGARENDLRGEKMIMNDNYTHLSPPNFPIFDEVMTDWISEQEQNHPGTYLQSLEKWLDV